MVTMALHDKRFLGIGRAELGLSVVGVVKSEGIFEL